MKKIIFAIGLLSGIGLTIFDYATSYLGFQSLLSDNCNAFFRILAPLVLAGLALAMNGSASQMMQLFVTNKEHKIGVFMLAITFLICISFDLGSSFIGFLLQATGETDFLEACAVATDINYITSGVVALFFTLGPFISMIFHELVNREGGLWACLFGFMQA